MKTNTAVDYVYTELNVIVYREEYDVPVTLAKYTRESLARIFVLLKFR